MSGKPLKMAVRMSIIPEISKQNYDTLAKQFREVIANAFDAHAKSINISIENVANDNVRCTNLIFEDDGFGMTETELESDYLGVGGSWKAQDDETIGRIGIGSLAVAVLCDRLLIETCKKGTNDVVVAELLIGQQVKHIDRSLEVGGVEVGRVLEHRAPRDTEGPHFTRLTLQGVNPDTVKILESKERFNKVIWELRRILPLPYPQNHPLYEKLEPSLREMLKGGSLKTITVRVSAPCIGPGELELSRYVYGHPLHEEERINGLPRSISLIKIEGGKNQNLQIYGYLVDAGKQLPEEQQGLVVRVKNMGVELNCLFESDDTSANGRITGELFIENLDEKNAMTINRNELVKDHVDYLVIRDHMQEILKNFKKEVRGRVEINSKIKKHVERASGIREAFHNVGEAIDQVGIELESCDEKEQSALRNAPDVDIKAEIKSLAPKIEVYPMHQLPKSHDVKHNDDSVEVTLNDEILEGTFMVGLDEFRYYLKHGESNDPPCEIFASRSEIFVNVNHPILKGRGDQIIRAVIALRFAYLDSNGDAKRLYINTLNILGEAFK